MSISGSKGSNSERSRMRVDPATQDWINRINRATQEAANAGPMGLAPGLGDVGGFFSGMFPGAQQGMAALGGDPNAVNTLMNPYLSQVVDATNADFDRSAALAQRGQDDAATFAGAFGGSRHGVASGVAQGAIEQDRNAALAGLRYGGFTDAMNRANQLTNFGFMGAQGLQGYDAYMRQAQSDIDGYRMNVLRQGFMGLPYGQDTRGKSSGWSLGFTRKSGS